MISKIIQDISRYQSKVDFKYLKSVGQNYIIIKAGSGNGTIDRRFEEHYAGARTAGMIVSPYFWVDPIYDATKQASFFVNLIANKEIGFIILDFEQWWGDWQKWAEMNAGMISKNSVPVVDPLRMLNHFRTVYNYFVYNTNYNIVIYTAPWFLNAYCKAGYNYFADKYTHWADYSLYGTNKISTNWNYLESIAPIGRMIPTLPSSYPKDKVLLWQFSGDKFMAQGVYSDIYGKQQSLLDLNIWMNPTITIENICGKQPLPEPQPQPEPDPLIEKWEVWSTTGLNIRSEPNALSSKIGILAYKEQFGVTSVSNGWGKLYGRLGYTSLYYAKKISITPLPPPVVSTTKWMITALVLNVRKAPVNGEVLTTLKYGQIVEITAIENGWGKLYGRDGYISMAYAKQV